jgi:hypothetical protein
MWGKARKLKIRKFVVFGAWEIWNINMECPAGDGNWIE